MTKFARLDRLPPYVFATVNQIKMEARHAGKDIIDLGMGNPDLPAPDHVVDKLVEASRNPQSPVLCFHGDYPAQTGHCRLVQAALRCGSGSRPGGHCHHGRQGGAVPPDSGHHPPRRRGVHPHPDISDSSYSAIIAGGDVRGIPLGPDQDFFENLISATPPDLAEAQDSDHQLSTTRPPR